MVVRSSEATAGATLRMIGIVPVLFLAATALASGGAFRSTAHGDREKGVLRRDDALRGSCIQCHEQHGKREGGRQSSQGLFAPSETLCFECHSNPSSDGGYPAPAVWARSAHAMARAVAGERKSRPDTGGPNGCANCHDPHGVRDARGVVPAMLVTREPDVCTRCHDGSNGKDIRSEITKSHVHGAFAKGDHRGDEGGEPARFGGLPRDRHVACSDCHNAHAVGRNATLSSGDPSDLPGASRLRILNGPAGSIPTYSWSNGDDLEAPRQFEVCFKCHSSWTELPAGSPDIARLTNPENPSFHPIQAQGKNRNIASESFVDGATGEDLLRCTDCHSSDDRFAKGPHGSTHERLLRKRSPQTLTAVAARDDLCFQCHVFAVYVESHADSVLSSASRFNAPAGSGHGYHVGVQNISCNGCHETHGSTTLPNLIARRMPGILSFRQTPTGGMCTSSCHAPKTYTVNYAR